MPPSRFAYSLMYRLGAAWDIGPRRELVKLVEEGRLTPRTLPPGRALDLGSGTGANVIFLAENGFHATGVDFSRVAVRRALRTAARRGLESRAHFVLGDLTAPEIPGVEPPFDLLVSYGTLEDFWPRERLAMAATVKRLSRPEGIFLLWCFYAAREDLPRFSIRGPSRFFPLTLEPGEEERLFADAFEIEQLPVLSPRPAPRSGARCFLMTRR
jgi:SAM-dependent methyltransferase